MARSFWWERWKIPSVLQCLQWTQGIYIASPFCVFDGSKFWRRVLAFEKFSLLELSSHLERRAVYPSLLHLRLSPLLLKPLLHQMKMLLYRPLCKVMMLLHSGTLSCLIIAKSIFCVSNMFVFVLPVWKRFKALRVQLIFWQTCLVLLIQAILR